MPDTMIRVYGAKVPLPFETIERSILSDAQEGWCLECGAVRGGCEPDARKYRCDNCGKYAVYGAEEIFVMAF